MRTVVVWCVLLACGFGIARAEAPPATPAEPPPATPSPPSPPAPAPPISAPAPPAPPPVRGPTIVTGRVTDVLGRPVRNSRVYVLPRRGAPYRTRTNADGRYSVQVTTLGTHGVVIAIGKAHTFRSVLVKPGATNTLDIDVELDSEGGEVIKIEDKKRPLPAVKPKPLGDPRASLPYSDEAVERDAWARAWLLLDVDETGAVSRLKMLKRPGFALERICIQKAFELRFSPALDGTGRPMKTYVLWTMEWPSWGWLVQGNGTAVHRPNDADELHGYAQNVRQGVEGSDLVQGVEQKIGGPWSRPLPSGTAFPHSLSRVPCLGSGPLNLDLRNRAYRDCSQPDMSKADALPWITRDTAQTAVIEMMRPDLMIVEQRVPGSRVPGYVGLGVTGALIAATTVAYLKFDAAEDRVIDNGYLLTTDPEAYDRIRADRTRWGKLTLGLSAATILATGVTLFIWNRNQSQSSFSVQPTASSDGAGASFTMSW